MKEFIDRDLGLTNIPDNIRINALKNVGEFNLNGIWVFTGSQGAGKTLLLIHTLKDIVKSYPEVKVVSNINLYGVDFAPYVGVEDFERYNNGAKGTVYVIDEIQALYSSLESKSMPPSMLSVWSQNRKNRRVILSTSQRWSRLAKPIREQATFNVECRKPFLWFYRYSILDAENYDDEGNYCEKKPPFRIYVPKISNMLSYNTLEVVKREGDRLQ